MVGAFHSSARQHTQSKSVKLQGLCKKIAALFRWDWRPWAAQARPALRPKAASLLVWTGGPQGPEPESGLHNAI